MLMSSRTTRLAAIYLGLAGLVALVFLQTAHFSFVNYDDGSYVFENPNIRAGLNARGIVRAFTHIHAQNWHPLTSISHMIDCQFFGLNAGQHHLVNVGLHTVAALLLFAFLWHSTDALWASAITAAIFAVHPLRVESVAWISERKDVLSGVFFMLTLVAYVRYVRAPRWQRMALVAAYFTFGLMSKPMLVTTPIVLLLLDYWPFRRFEKQGLWKVILEKVPLIILALGSCTATLIAQRLAIGTAENLPLTWRFNNALVSYVNYLRQMFWPVDLVPFYIHAEGRLAIWQVAAAIALLIVITTFAVVLRRKLPFLLVGWLWYLIMLLP